MIKNQQGALMSFHLADFSTVKVLKLHNGGVFFSRAGKYKYLLDTTLDGNFTHEKCIFLLIASQKARSYLRKENLFDEFLLRMYNAIKQTRRKTFRLKKLATSL